MSGTAVVPTATILKNAQETLNYGKNSDVTLTILVPLYCLVCGIQLPPSA